MKKTIDEAIQTAKSIGTPSYVALVKEIAQLRRELELEKNNHKLAVEELYECSESLACAEKRTEYLVDTERKRAEHAEEKERFAYGLYKCEEQRADLNERAWTLWAETNGFAYDEHGNYCKQSFDFFRKLAQEEKRNDTGTEKVD